MQTFTQFHDIREGTVYYLSLSKIAAERTVVLVKKASAISIGWISPNLSPLQYFLNVIEAINIFGAISVDKFITNIIFFSCAYAIAQSAAQAKAVLVQ